MSKIFKFRVFEFIHILAAYNFLFFFEIAAIVVLEKATSLLSTEPLTFLDLIILGTITVIFMLGLIQTKRLIIAAPLHAYRDAVEQYTGESYPASSEGFSFLSLLIITIILLAILALDTFCENGTVIGTAIVGICMLSGFVTTPLTLLITWFMRHYRPIPKIDPFTQADR